MASNRLWMVGCFAFAALSGYLAFDRTSMRFNQYASGVRDRTVTAQRDVLFQIIQLAQPPIQAAQIQRAAEAAKISIERRDASLLLTSGIEFVLSGDDVKAVRSVSFK